MTEPGGFQTRGSTESLTPERMDDWFPWPPPPGASPLEALFRTWQLSVFQPSRFFGRMPAQAPIGPAVLYFLIIGIPAVGIALFWQMLFEIGSAGSGLAAAPLEAPIGPWLPLIQFLLSPIFLLVGLGIAFVINHAILAIVGGARRGPGTTLRTLCFAYSPVLFVVIPFVGSVIGGVWTVVLTIIGLRESHQTDGWRAATAVLLPIVIVAILFIIAAALIGVAAVYLAGQGFFTP